MAMTVPTRDATYHSALESHPWRDAAAKITPGPDVLSGRSAGCGVPLALRSHLTHAARVTMALASMGFGGLV